MSNHFVSTVKSVSSRQVLFRCERRNDLLFIGTSIGLATSHASADAVYISAHVRHRDSDSVVGAFIGAV